ncbi:structural maintenance of chromosomes flexible hinge domain-containing protein GMI1-like isoform X2 [Salvia splendens]|uniref:structural maintenance of chromosomes flexible hinge domain-containing protein GMI1-like isoform X2 n=1 Tax=Salvia splendens TaxID=180675 RepID=UPI001C272FA3|nr:structural maintenance of chromosomes flexible hinge domain-containing protein GMI1-like isoform X2 [Salvia splendens]
MYSKSPLSGTKKRPHEASGVEGTKKSRPVVDVYGDVFDNAKVMTPPMKLNKRPREETPGKSSSGTVQAKDDGREMVYRFRVLLPNGTAVELKMSELRKEMPIEKFIGIVRREYSLLANQKTSLGQKRRINWDYQDLHFTDTQENKIKLKIDFQKFLPNIWHLLWLHDGSLEPDEYEDMWDLTPDTDLLKELPDDYTCETALADLIDNSLQALWSNGKGERRLISVQLEPGKISIFDSGPGMDGANGNIVKWGKMGASLHRSMREKAIGGEPPYLMPFFGMFGYGGPVAAMCLGRRAVVSSKTKQSNKVFTLHMEREALVSASHLENCWKTKGGIRDPWKDENLKSPHGSFTKVEIFDPKPKVKNLYIRQLRRKLKDIYFPYIQVNEMDLAGIQGGEVATTNMHSCNGPEFILQVQFSTTADSSAVAGQNQRVSATANARLKCVYFPIVGGTESIQMILDKLNEDHCGIKESFESFSRVSVRRLGRLLPDVRWGLLPFMEPKHKVGERAKILMRLCSRVKCFIDTDSGFNPTPHKTDLAHHHPYTKALKNFGKRSDDDRKEVHVKISRDGKALTFGQLQTLYNDWVMEMHDRYDEETDDGLDEPMLIVGASKEKKNKKLDLKSSVLRVHKEIQRKGRCWKAGMNIKILRGACAGCHNNNVYATLEYVILEGIQGDASGEARLICRPLGLPEEKSCHLLVREGNCTIDINDSYVFPIRIIDSDKCLPVDDIEWKAKLEAFKQKLPAAIDLLSQADCQELEIDGGMPSLLNAGDFLPDNIVAVVRPCSFNNGNSSKRLDQKFIVRDNQEMILEIFKHRASDGEAGSRQHAYSVRHPPESYKGLHGLYIFPLGSRQRRLCEEPGILTCSFSLKGIKDIKLEHKVQVQGPYGIGRWVVLNHDENEPYTVRVGSCCRTLSIVCLDEHKKRIRFKGVPNLLIKLTSNGRNLARDCRKKVEITPDKLTMKIKDISISSSELDHIRPNYEARLLLSTPDKAFSVALPCQVMPAPPKKITVHPTELRKQLLPGQIIEELVLEVFDEYGNHLKENDLILLRLDGLSIQDGSGINCGLAMESKKKVDANGRVDLSNLLKVSAGYGKRVMLSVMSKDGVIFELRFQTEVRELRALQKVFMNYEAGSLLKNVAFEIVDSEGKVDERIHDDDKHGQSHTLVIKCRSFRIDESVTYRFLNGCCTVPSIRLPREEGAVFFEAVHSHHPELKFSIKVIVQKARQKNRDNVRNHADIGNHIHQPKYSSENEAAPEILRSQVHIEKQQQEKLDSAMNPDGVVNPIISTPISSEHEHNFHILPSLRVSDFMNEISSPHSLGNPILSTPRSSEHGQNLPVSPPLRASQVMNETFSPHSSGSPFLSIPRSPGHGQVLPIKPPSRVSQEMNTTFSLPSSCNSISTPSSSKLGFLPVSPSLRVPQVKNEILSPHSSKGCVSPISDSPPLKTPILDTHTQSRSPVTLCSKESCSEQELEDNLINSSMQISSQMEKLEIQRSTLSQIQLEISQLQAVIAPDLGTNALNVCGLYPTIKQIESRSQTAAAAICKMLEDDLACKGIEGVVALLGTVESFELSRMLALFLGEGQMLAIVCRNYAAAQSLDANTLHKLAGYNAFCLEDIRPRSNETSSELLPLQELTLPNRSAPHGFLGYAVDLINIEPDRLHWRTTSGHGLRETLFHRLFGKLQVYKDRDCMMAAAQSCIEGAVSLDGGILRGNGLLSLGLREPTILFPVMKKATPAESLRKLAAKEMELVKIKQRVDEEEDALRLCREKFSICQQKYNSYISQTQMGS